MNVVNPQGTQRRIDDAFEHTHLHVELVVDINARQCKVALGNNRPAAEQHLTVLPASVDNAAVCLSLATVDVE